jgi:hypothetical protein
VRAKSPSVVPHKCLYVELTDLDREQLSAGGNDLAQNVRTLGVSHIASGIGVALGKKGDDSLGELAQRGGSSR